MICSLFHFITIKESIFYSIRLPNGDVSPVTHIGAVQVTDTILLQDVICVPSFTFKSYFCQKTNQTTSMLSYILPELYFILGFLSWTTIGKGKVMHGFYHLQRGSISPTTLVSALSTHFRTRDFILAYVQHISNGFDLWHFRLGHVSDSRIQLIQDPIVVSNVGLKGNYICHVCPLSKQHRLPFPTSTHQTSTLFELIHCDIGGPCFTEAHDGTKYLSTIVFKLFAIQLRLHLIFKSRSSKVIMGCSFIYQVFILQRGLFTK